MWTVTKLKRMKKEALVRQQDILVPAKANQVKKGNGDVGPEENGDFAKEAFECSEKETLEDLVDDVSGVDSLAGEN